MSTAVLQIKSKPYFAWKGKTFVQVTAALQKNTGTIPTTSKNIQNIFHPTPLKLYRREIASTAVANCNPRISLSIDELNSPNGYLVYNSNNKYGLDNTLDINSTTNKYELSTSVCNNSTNCFNQANNARRRVRSSGMITKKFNSTKNNDQYYSDTTQYLKSRNRTFEQNQYNYIRQGDPTAKPGSPFALNNLYSANGTSHCDLYKISAEFGNNTFSYVWINGSNYNVTIPDGYYNINTFYDVLKSTMTTNKHYYINNANGSKIFLLNIVFNTSANYIQLQSFLINGYYNNASYSAPVSTTWSVSGNVNKLPYFIIPATFSAAIGFTAGSYPSSPFSTSNSYINSNTSAGLQPTYVSVFYKPNNSQFAQQGAVESSALISRLKYDTLTGVGSTLRSPSGANIANTLAYSVPTATYSYIKKGGKPFPVKLTPKINPYNGQMKKCQIAMVY
jgi:hypothetical protein